jgi:FkbM family methyltransferase
MSKLINYQYTPEGRIFIEVGPSYGLDIFPLKLEHRNSISNELSFEAELTPYSWANTPIFTENCYILILDKNQNILYKSEVDNFRDGDEVQNIFDIWAKTNIGAVGIAAGTNDGTGGEWVRYVKDNQLKAFLLEPAKESFTKLHNNFSKNLNTVLMNVALTVNGGKVIFHTELNGPGYANSTKLESVQQHYSQITSYEVDSVRIEDMLRLYKPKWLHLDVEGIDQDIIYETLKFPELLPEIIIYEHICMDENTEQEVYKKLILNNYTVVKGQKHNSIAIKNK